MDEIALFCSSCLTNFSYSPAPADKTIPCPHCAIAVTLPGPRLRAVKWYYVFQEVEVGPVGFAQMQRLATTGIVTETTMVRADGMQEPIAASRVPQLFAAVELDRTSKIQPKPESKPSYQKQASKLPIYLTIGAVGLAVLCGILALVIGHEPNKPEPVAQVPVVTKKEEKKQKTPPSTKAEKFGPIRNDFPDTPDFEKADPPVREPINVPLVKLPLLERVRPGEVHPVLILERPAAPAIGAESFQGGVIARELVRQALLMSAREQLGLATRDAVLREPTEGLPKRTIGADIKFIANEPSHFILKQNDESFADFEMEVTVAEKGVDYLQLCQLAEKLSRDQLPKALKKAGFDGKANEWKDSLGVHRITEKRLLKWNIQDQFGAIRELHAQMHGEGESPQRLGALVRAYANLGSLTDCFWSPAHKVFKARSLLYAQRLIAKEDSSFAQWHLAYALALAGLNQPAREVVKKATEMPASEDRPAPAWTEALNAFVVGDNAKLHTMSEADGEYKQLIIYLLLLRESDPRCPQQTYTAGEWLRDENPDAESASDRICQINMITPLQRMTDYYLTDYNRSIDQRFATIAGFTDVFGDGNLSMRKQLPTAFREESRPNRDRREPSWSILSRSLEDAQFQHFFRRLHMEQNVFSGSEQELATLAERMAVMMGDHPFKPFIASFAMNARRQPREMKALFDQIPTDDIDFRAMPFIRTCIRVDPQRTVKLIHQARIQSDFTVGDLEAQVDAIPTDEGRAEVAGWLLDLDTDNDIGRSLAIEHLWSEPRVEERIAQWEKEADRHAAVARAFALRYSKDGKKEDARKFMKLALKKSRDASLYLELADTYRSEGKMQEYVQALEESLEATDLGLVHADAQVKRLTIGSEVNREAWLLWCIRTGSDNLPMAKKAFFDTFVGRLDSLTGREAFELGMGHLVLGEREKSLEYLTESLEKTPSPMTGMIIMLIADQLESARGRDQMLTVVGAAPSPVAKIAKRFAKSIKDKKPLDEDECEQLLEALPIPERFDYLYVIGQFLLLHGDEELGRAYLEKCLQTPEASVYIRTLAKVAMRSGA